MNIKTFSSGLTDDVIDGDPSSAKRLNNVFINEHGKTVQRDGIDIYNASAPQIPPGVQRVDSLYYFDSTLFLKSGTKLYYIEDDDVAWTTLAGPTGNDAFADSELGAKCSWSEWRGHLFITPGPTANVKGGSRTVKVYRRASGAWFLVQAGLPRLKDAVVGGLFTSTGTPGSTENYSYIFAKMFVREYVALVNGVSTVFKDYGQPIITQEIQGAKITAGGGDLDGSYTYVNLSLENYDTAKLRFEYFRTKADQTELLFINSFKDPDSADSSSDDEDLGEARVTVPFTVSGTAGGVVTVGTTNIAFFYLNQSNVSVDDDNSGSTDGLHVVAINYVTGTITLSSTRGGAPLSMSSYTTGQNATVTFDYASKMPSGYEESNFNDPCPKSYFSAINDSYGWFAGVEEANTNFHKAGRLAQSKPLDVDAVPGGNFVDVTSIAMTALSFASQHPVVFTRNQSFRIENRLDAYGNGNLRAIRISDTEGAVSQDVIRTPDGIYFASENGFCYTNGFSVVNLTKSTLRRTYADLLVKTRMAGCYDSNNHRVIWGVESSDLEPTVSGKNNAAFILDTKLTKGHGVFTTASAGENFQPNALHYDSANKRILIGDQRGYVFKFNADLTTDPGINTATAYSTWHRVGIVWDIITVAFSFGSSQFSKWMRSLYFVARNLTGDLSVDITIYKDDRSAGVRGKAIRDRGITSGIHKCFRYFPKGVLNCIYSQIQLKKGLVNIARSDDYATAAVNGTLNTALLGVGNWPLDGADSLVGHTIYFGPLYATGWVIAAQSGDTLTLTDTGNTLPTGTFEWLIKGYPKNESLELHDINIDYDVIGEGYPDRSDSGANT